MPPRDIKNRCWVFACFLLFEISWAVHGDFPFSFVSPITKYTDSKISARKVLCNRAEKIVPHSSRSSKPRQPILASNANQECDDILSVLQNLDVELNNAIRREEYDAASRLKRQIEEMRRDASLGNCLDVVGSVPLRAPDVSFNPKAFLSAIFG